jgi:hypothetical protein
MIDRRTVAMRRATASAVIDPRPGGQAREHALTSSTRQTEGDRANAGATSRSGLATSRAER